MNKFKFEVHYKDHHGQEKKRVVKIEHAEIDIAAAKNLAALDVKGNPADRNRNSFELATEIEILSIKEIRDDA